MDDLQTAYDDAVFAFTQGDYTAAIAQFEEILAQDPGHFEARLSLGMAHYRLGDYKCAITEGHKAEELDSKEQRVHTNLSLFYMKNGDKEKAEHHGLQARIAGWRDDMGTLDDRGVEEEMKMAESKPEPIKLPEKFPEMPWKKKKDNQ